MKDFIGRNVSYKGLDWSVLAVADSKAYGGEVVVMESLQAWPQVIQVQASVLKTALFGEEVLDSGPRQFRLKLRVKEDGIVSAVVNPKASKGGRLVVFS